MGPALIGGIFAAAILAFYVWIRRRPRLTVSYVAIWRRVAEQQPQRHWLRWLTSLLLALATAGMLVYAASGLAAEPPGPEREEAAAPRHVVVLLDTSPSAWAEGWAQAEVRQWTAERLRALAEQVTTAGPAGQGTGGTLTLAWEEPSGLFAVEVQGEPQAALEQRLAAIEPLYPLEGRQAPDWPAVAEAAHRRLEATLAREAAHAGRSGEARTRYLAAQRDEVRWLLFSDGKRLPEPWQPLAGEEARWQLGKTGGTELAGLVVEAWRAPLPASSVNAAIRGVRHEKDAEGSRLYVQVAVSPREHEQTFELHTEPSITAEPLVIPAQRQRAEFELALPEVPPPGAVREADGSSWRLTVSLRPAGGERQADARPADDAVTVRLPVREPVPVVVLGPQAQEPLVRALLQVLQQRKVLRVISREEVRTEGLAPVVILLGQANAPGEAFPATTRGILAVAGPGAAGTGGQASFAPGRAVRITPEAPAELAELDEVPLTVRQARVLPRRPEAQPLLQAGDAVVADYLPANEAHGEVARVRFGFGFGLSQSDFLAQPGVAPVMMTRLLQLLAPQRTSPLPPVAEVGKPLKLHGLEALREEIPVDATVQLTLPGQEEDSASSPPVPFAWLAYGAAEGAPGEHPEMPRWVPKRPGTVELTITPGPASTLSNGTRAARTLRWQTAAQLFNELESRLPLREGRVAQAFREVTSREEVSLFDEPRPEPPHLEEHDGAAEGEPYPKEPFSWPLWQLLALGALLFVLLEALLYRLRLAE